MRSHVNFVSYITMSACYCNDEISWETELVSSHRSHRLVADCHYFLPGPQLPFQSQTVPSFDVLKHTAWWQRWTICPQLTLDSRMAGVMTAS